MDMTKKAEDAGLDAIIATGIEAGGHLGKEGATTFCLIPQLSKAFVVAAGGFAVVNTFRAVLALGASGAEIGTRFLATSECPVPDYFKKVILYANVRVIVFVSKGAMPMRV